MSITKHFVLPSSHGPMGVSLTPEEIKAANRMMDGNPEKYPEGAEGVLHALKEIREIEGGICKKTM